jgi:hypothetical protein
MGLYKGKVQIYLQAFICYAAQTIKERSTYQRRRYEEKQREKKLSIKKHGIPRF